MRVGVKIPRTRDGTIITLEVQRLFVQWFFRKDYCFSKGLLSKILGNAILMVFDFHGLYSHPHQDGLLL